MSRWLGVMACLLACAAQAEDWPTAAHDAARTGRTADVAPGPYRVRWAKAWQYENIATTCQLIVAEGRGFIGTLGRDGSLAGKVHSVDVRDGRDLWTYDDLQGGIAHTLTWSPAHGGTVYAATSAGELIALEAATGKRRWRFETPLGGFVVNPCVADSAVLVGSRQGVFYGINESDGSVRWQRDVKLPICQTAAAADGVVYFIDEGMHTHALRIADGKPAEGWIPRQLHGGSARFYWPVVTKDHVLLTVAPPHQYNWGQTDQVLFKVPGVAGRKGNRFAIGKPEQEEAEQANVQSFLKDSPHNQVMHCLSRANGRVACRPGVLYTGGSGSECAPPVVTKDGRIVVEYRSWYSLWDSDSWVNPYSALGTLDPATGVVTQLRPELQDGRVPWGHVWIIADESSSFSIAGDTLLVAHQGNFGGFDFASGKTFAGIGKRDTWGGYPALSWSRQEWHGGPRSPLTIVDGTIYYVVGGRVIACEGNAKPGDKNAEPVVVPAMEKVVLPEFKDEKSFPTRDDIDRLLSREPTKGEADRKSVEVLHQALERHVVGLIEMAPHAALHEWRGISPSAHTMTSRGEIAYTLTIALPHLSEATRKRALAFASEQIRSTGALYEDVTYPPRSEPRNFHRVDRNDYNVAARVRVLTGARQDFYTLNAFREALKATDDERAPSVAVVRASHADDLMKARVRELIIEDDPLQTFDRVSKYSRELSHIIGRARIAISEQRPRDIIECEKKFLGVLKPYLDEYRHIGRECAKHIDAVPGDDKHPSAGGQFRNLGGPYLGQTHMAAIVYWTDLCPEVGALLKEYAPEETAAIKAWMLRNAQGFYLARWDTPIQEGEVACPWYVTTQNYFHVFSTIDGADAATHKLLVDMPVCHADVYYIERLVRAIEAGSPPREEPAP